MILSTASRISSRMSLSLLSVSVLTSEWRELRPTLGDDGYYRLCLRVDGRRVYRRVHSIVLESFVGPCPDGYVGCHNNGDCLLNAWWNLRWDTQAANLADKIKHGTHLYGERHHQARLTASDVIEIRRRWASGGIRQRELGNEFGVTKATISAVVRGCIWKHVSSPETAMNSADVEIDDEGWPYVTDEPA
jgi:hypothetical protein